MEEYVYIPEEERLTVGELVEKLSKLDKDSKIRINVREIREHSKIELSDYVSKNIILKENSNIIILDNIIKKQEELEEGYKII